MSTIDDPAWQDDPLWYKDAIIYQLHVKAFLDSSGDGVGDFRGLTEKLDYIQDLGVNTLWLLPFYPSPMRDDGYDIADYRNIHPDYGTRRDFRQFVREAHRRGLKVITELVINHTSDQHPWFQAARRAPEGSAKRNFYVWSKTKHKFPETRIIFTDTESSNWAWDDEAQAYYWHRFFSHQPDLNHNNPQVVQAIIRVMRFWLDMGVDGLRLDAIPYLCVREGTSNENLPETHGVIREMRSVVDAHYANRLFLAEANQWPEDVSEYFGDGDECHMAYHFPLMPRMYMAVAQEDRHPIVEIMRQTPEIPENCQWAVFLRNHDELTLEMVTNRERDYMYQVYATDKRMRINLGIRRRLAPLMDNDPDKIKLMNSLLMSMPGSPIVYYGDEIGMGDNIYLGDRNGVRTPMQWSPDRNAGFSRVDPQRLYLPPIMDPIYGFQAVNVEAQSRAASSLLNWMKRMIAVRKSFKAFGRGTLEFLHPGNRKILAYVRAYDEETILCVVNLSHTAQPVELDLSLYRGSIPMELMGRIPFPPIGDLPYLLTLPAYGIYWFRLTTEAEEPPWHEERLPPPELPVLVLFAGWHSFFPEEVEGNRKGPARRLCIQFEAEVVPKFLPLQRWYAAKGEAIERTELIDHTLFGTEEGDGWMLTRIRVICADLPPQTYFIPLTLMWGDEETLWPLLHFTLAKIRRHAHIGFLCDAFSDDRFLRAILQALGEDRELPFGNGVLRFSATEAFAELAGGMDGATTRRPGAEGSNTTVIVNERLFVKGYRQLHEGINPEVEVGRFLTERSPFSHIIPVAGSAEYVAPNGESTPLLLVQAYVENQGDAWSYLQDYLERFIEGALTERPDGRDQEAELHGHNLLMMHTLGLRTGGLHRALSARTDDPDFAPETMSAVELRNWLKRLRKEAGETMKQIAARLEQLPDEVKALARRTINLEPQLYARIEEQALVDITPQKIRHHGDYHLGQVLVVQNDFVIIDFEGEPARPLTERRAKQPALRDVAGLLRSLSYAGYASLLRLTSERPGDFDVLEPYVRDWERLAGAAFLDGYAEGVRDCAACSDGSGLEKGMLEIYLLEKALYEIRYELDNRPAWLGIPLRGLLDLLREPE